MRDFPLQKFAHCAVQFAEISEGEAGSWIQVKVAVRAEFRSNRENILMKCGDPLPAREMAGEILIVPGGLMISDLWPLIVTDSGVDMADPPLDGSHPLRNRSDGALANDAPVGDVEGEEKLRQLVEEAGGPEWMEGRAGAVGFHANPGARLAGDCEKLSQKTARSGKVPEIRAGESGDPDGLQRQGGIELPPEVLEVIGRSGAE